MKMTIFIGALLFAGAAHAQTTNAVATQQSAATSTAQGTIQFSQSPADTVSTVRNVSAPVLGAYAGSFSQMGCGSTAQGGVAFAGVSVVGGASHSMLDCKLEVAAAETVRQATVTADPAVKERLEGAAIAIRCQVSDEVWKAYLAAGLDCLGLAPKDADTQPVNYRVASH